ncbi:S-adenosyl-L-methionine-dependent methyltransferase [Hymenopellis radicata]|nr:S-adenosyl-L-methionine-dependent methyltransferase [Hymenopellis radicata]
MLGRRFYSAATRSLRKPPQLLKPIFHRGESGSLAKGTPESPPPPPSQPRPPPVSLNPHELPLLEDIWDWKSSFGIMGKRKHAEDESPEQNQQKKRQAKIKRWRKLNPDECGPEDVQWQDIVDLLGKETIDSEIVAGTEFDSPFEDGEEAEVQVLSLCASGKGLALSPESKGKKWALLIPFAFPGETVRVRVFRTNRMHSTCDLLEVLTPNLEYRDESVVKCKYFRTCGGCQYQMLPYERQLRIKRDVVVKAYATFSKLDASEVPEVGPTVASPLQYNYRTKITPHFHLTTKEDDRKVVNIGFNNVAGPGIIDIEECPIATTSINQELGPSRQKVHDNISTYRIGATLLLRESLKTDISLPLSSALSEAEVEDARNTKIAVTHNQASVRERVGDTFFEFNGGSFFQNNNSILETLTGYIKDAIFPPGMVDTPTHLIDTYCGAGLFGITLAEHFEKITGVELSADSIMYAKRNARVNKIPSTKISFKAGDAADIFATVKDFPSERTAVIIDPRGKQVVKFLPQTVAYVSCNVHSQARDIGKLLNKTKRMEKRYVLESVRGFDLFPQTSHVESVAILRLVDAKS